MNWFNNITLERVADFTGNTQRPWSTFILSLALAIACCIKDTAPIAIPVAGAVLGGNAYTRMNEKNKIADADADVKKTAIQSGSDTTTVNTKVP